jgi:hypothetical protein
MRIFYILVFSSLILFVSSCNKKQDEVKVNKFSGKDSTSTGKKEYNDSAKTNELSSSGENILTVTTEDVKNHIGENAIVKGYVADVVIREKVEYLNFDRKFPKNTFSAVIFSEKFSEVGDLSIYKNQNIEVKGVISTYKDKPQIIVSSKNQIRIIK